MTGEPAIRPAGRDCELYSEDVFRELRSLAQVPHDFANSGWDLDKLQHGGGKGGSQMARIGTSYIVKELSKGDHVSLLQVAASYGQHVRSGDTLLCPIYIHFRDNSTGRYFFAMRNSIGSGPFRALYDLKGCADDKLLEEDGKAIKAVHKRIWNVGMWCGKSKWTEDRRRYHSGKVKARRCDIAIAPDQRAQLLQMMERDTAWLTTHRLMDYSLLVAVRHGKGSLTHGGIPLTVGQRPFCFKDREGNDVAVHVAIIDFLQRWTLGKKVARCIKCAECNKATVPPSVYARRFNRNFAARFQGEGQALPPVEQDLPSPSKVPASVAPPADRDVKPAASPEDKLAPRPIPEEGPRAPVPAMGPPGVIKVPIATPVLGGNTVLHL